MYILRNSNVELYVKLFIHVCQNNVLLER